MISQKKLGEKIKEVRESLNLSQEDLSNKVSLTRAAISEIERGNRGVEALELSKIVEVFNVDIDYFLREEGPAKAREPIIKKDFKFNEDKLKNVILYILEKCGGKPNVGETVLYKLLYFIDFDGFEIVGRPITGMNYIRLQYGPVPSANEYLPVVNSMTEKKELQIIMQQYYGMPQKRYIALVNSNIGLFKPQEIKIMDTVIANLSDKTARQIEDYVHEDAPWKLTKEKQFIRYGLVFERSIPYAHYDYDNLWMDAAGEDVLKELGPMSEAEFNYYKNL